MNGETGTGSYHMVTLLPDIVPAYPATTPAVLQTQTWSVLSEKLSLSRSSS